MRRHCKAAVLTGDRASISLAPQHLSPLLAGQGDHFAAGAARENDIGRNGLSDEVKGDALF